MKGHRKKNRSNSSNHKRLKSQGQMSMGSLNMMRQNHASNQAHRSHRRRSRCARTASCWQRFCGQASTRTEAHRERHAVPQKALHAWDFLVEQQDKHVALDNIEPQCIEFFLSPELPEPELRIPVATIHPAQVAMVEQSGSGEAIIIPRFKFTAWCDWSDTVRQFVTNDYDIQLWMRMGATQGSLL